MKTAIIFAVLIIAALSQNLYPNSCGCVDGAEFIPKNNQCIWVDDMDNLIKNCARMDAVEIEDDFTTGILDMRYSCMECEAGYFSVSGGRRCISMLDNCELQTSTNNCQMCKAGYYRDSTDLITGGTAYNLCLKANAIKNCVQYAGEDWCIKCETNFYLKSSSECAAVNTKISNCAVYDDADTCDECNEGYHMHDTEGTCHSNVNNCELTYVDYSTYQTKPGSQTNEDDGTVCKKCILGYFYDLGASKPSCIVNTSNGSGSKVSGCAVYGWDSIDEEVVCVTGDGKTLYINDAEKIDSDDKVDNCNLHAEFDECHECNSGYSVDYQGYCLKHPSSGKGKVNNCRTYEYIDDSEDFQGCKVCEEGYYAKVYEGTGYINECSSCPSTKPKGKKNDDGCSSASIVSFSASAFLLVLIAFLSL